MQGGLEGLHHSHLEAEEAMEWMVIKGGGGGRSKEEKKEEMKREGGRKEKG